MDRKPTFFVFAEAGPDALPGEPDGAVGRGIEDDEY
jgi:hypothetical protein